MQRLKLSETSASFTEMIGARLYKLIQLPITLLSLKVWIPGIEYVRVSLTRTPCGARLCPLTVFAQLHSLRVQL